MSGGRYLDNEGGRPGLAYRTRVFIDFWNFSLNWNERAAGARIDWQKVPRVLLDEAKKQLETAGIQESLALEETLVYAWLDSFLDKQPSFRVNARERRAKARKIHCAVCGHDNDACQNCQAPFRWAPEKGVDTAIVTDLLALASEGAYDVAVLLSSDADHIPAVEWVQSRGLKVVNATWDHHGFDLAKTCWAGFELDTVIPLLSR
jgi:uncharacterized LabA/DUF88 family protein